MDASVFVAILQEEPEAERFLQAMRLASPLRVSAISLTEASIVLLRNSDESRVRDLDELLRLLHVIVEPVTEGQARHAVAAFRIYGKGNHPARLNLGDLFSYTLAVRLEEPLLFKGNDFSQTDVLVATY